MGRLFDIIRKLVCFVLMIGAGLALLSVFMGAGNVFQPLIDSFKPFNLSACGVALADLINDYLGIPFIMFMLGLIGFTFDDSTGVKNGR
jgi:hypothetical protein